MKQKNAKTAVAASNGNGDLRLIALSAIEPAADNVRKSSDKKKFAELVKSIKDKGVLQAILLRPLSGNNGNTKYCIVAGERRYRAAMQAGLTEIPAYVKELNADEALSAGLVENLLREDIHPLDEADGFLRMREELKLDLRAIASRVAKDARYVARRLSLTQLIAEAREDLRQERIALAHALEICRLDAEIQADALLACYELKTVPSQTEDGFEYVADKERPARPVQYLQEWLRKNVHLNLKQVPFKLDDPRLRADGLTCLNCPQRSGFDKTLFADIQDADTCLNPLCFQAKRQQFVQLAKAALEEKTGQPAVSISAFYGVGNASAGSLGLGEYQLLSSKADRCEHAVQAVFTDGDKLGQVKWVCSEPSCKDHLGYVRQMPTFNGRGTAAPSGESKHARKQELFDIKVDEIVRKRVFADALKTFAWPLERTHLDKVALEFFHRIPADVQKVICEVFGWGEELAATVRFSNEAVQKELAQLDDSRLVQFLMLCSVAHYGTNTHSKRRVDQSQVTELSQLCGVNHRLIDAEVRFALCAKKYREAHATYLAAVKNGASAEKPVVFERLAQPAPGATAGTTA